MKIWNDIHLLNSLSAALLGLAALVLLAALLVNLLHGPAFAIKVIRIESADGGTLRHVHPDVVRKTVLPRIQGNFFTLDRVEAAFAFEELPWVRKASVRRAWPDTLVVTLEEKASVEDSEVSAAAPDSETSAFR